MIAWEPEGLTPWGLRASPPDPVRLDALVLTSPPGSWLARYVSCPGWPETCLENGWAMRLDIVAIIV